MSQVTLKLDTAEWDAIMGRLFKNLGKAQAVMRVAAQAVAFADIIDHFAKEEGPAGKWPARSAATQHRYEMIASGQWVPPRGTPRGAFRASNKLLQLTGHLRQSIMPTNVEKAGADGIRIFANAKYSARHDQGGGGTPQRQFMWLSGTAQTKMAEMIVKLFLESEGDA